MVYFLKIYPITNFVVGEDKKNLTSFLTLNVTVDSDLEGILTHEIVFVLGSYKDPVKWLICQHF